MATDFEALAKLLLARSQGGKGGGDFEKYKEMLNTPQGKQLLAQLSGGGGDALKQAAGAAAQGDSDALRKMMTTLLSSKEGATLVKQAMDLYNQNKG